MLQTFLVTIVPSRVLNNFKHLCHMIFYWLPVTVFFLFSGYIAYNFVLGAYSYWGPKAGYNIYKMVENYQNVFVSLCRSISLDTFIHLQENADMIFGGITVICGIVGTLSGGVVLDFMDSTISNAFKVRSSLGRQIILKFHTPNGPWIEISHSQHKFLPLVVHLVKQVIDHVFLYFAASFSFNIYRSVILLCCLLFQEHVCIFSSFCCWWTSHLCHTGNIGFHYLKYLILLCFTNPPLLIDFMMLRVLWTS